MLKIEVQVCKDFTQKPMSIASPGFTKGNTDSSIQLGGAVSSCVFLSRDKNSTDKTVFVFGDQHEKQNGDSYRECSVASTIVGAKKTLGIEHYITSIIQNAFSENKKMHIYVLLELDPELVNKNMMLKDSYISHAYDALQPLLKNPLLRKHLHIEMVDIRTRYGLSLCKCSVTDVDGFFERLYTIGPSLGALSNEQQATPHQKQDLKRLNDYIQQHQLKALTLLSSSGSNQLSLAAARSTALKYNEVMDDFVIKRVDTLLKTASQQPIVIILFVGEFHAKRYCSYFEQHLELQLGERGEATSAYKCLRVKAPPGNG